MLQDRLLGGQDRELLPGGSAAGGAAAAATALRQQQKEGGGGVRAEQRKLQAAHAVRAAFAHAAQYVALAHALDAGSEVYAESLRAVHRTLPLPFLRAGALQAVIPGTAGTPGERWSLGWFGVDTQSMRSVRPPAAEAAAVGSSGREELFSILIDLADVTGAQAPASASPRWHARVGQLPARKLYALHTASPPLPSLSRPTLLGLLPTRSLPVAAADAATCHDPSLPIGVGICVSVRAGEGQRVGASGLSRHFFVAETGEDAEGWVDALLLLRGLVAAEKLDGMREVLQGSGSAKRR
jgi:hypothetical protein